MHDPLKRMFSAVMLIGCTAAGWTVLAQTYSLRGDAMVAAAQGAVSPDAPTAQRARAQLRAAGPAGLEALFTVHGDTIRRLLDPAAQGAPPSGPPASRLDERVRGAIDAVARQRDAHASRLFWYTDLTEARNAARAAHRPILSLRLLGNLDEELSCANSRYFRTALYANRAISDRLRAGWILHWESVRPAPHMTIDFGDGRRVERTVTGNSLHYVLDEDGDVIDVWPGLVAPAAFLRDLVDAESIAARVASHPEVARGSLLAEFHRERIADTERAWKEELAGGADVKALDAAGWSRVAARHITDARLDASSVALMRLKTRGLYDEASFPKVLATFEQALAADHLRNAYLMRPVIDSWFAAGDVPALAELTERVYDEVFLTPRRDPWLGLVPAGVYSGLEGDGRSLTAPTGQRAAIDGLPIPTDAEILKVGAPPTAVEAGSRAFAKSAVEMPTLNQVTKR